MRIISALCISFFTLVSLAQPALKVETEAMSADSAAKFEALAITTNDAAAWYNAGNVYYRRQDLAHAILCYERARRLEPSDADVAHNLRLCRATLQDRFSTPHEMFFMVWAKDLIYGFASSTWLAISLFTLALMLCAWLVFSHGRTTWLRKSAFSVAVVALLLTIFVLIAAVLAAHRFQTERLAVVMKETPLRTRSTRTATPPRRLHVGTTVTLTSTMSPDSLVEVLLPDGNAAWLQLEDLEKVVVEE